jgi:hypothetical protein
MDFVDDDRVGLEDVAFLEPASRDSRGHDDHVPRWCFGRRFALPIDDADFQRCGLEDFLSDWPNRERLTGACSGDDPKAFARASKLTHARAVAALEKCFDVKTDGELDGLACRARRRDDDDAAGWRLGINEGIVIRKIWLENVAKHEAVESKEEARRKRAKERPRDLELAEVIAANPRSLVFLTPQTPIYSGGFFGRICGTGETPVNPFAAGGSFDLSLPRPFAESPNSSPNTTRPFDGRFFRAVGQSVAAGC